MRRWIGLDLHKRFVHACGLDEAGQVVLRLEVRCTRQALLAFARRDLRPEDEVAVEATTNTWAVVDLLRPFVARVVVSNPLQTRAIASAKVKTDKIDARVLADLLRCRYLPEVWQPEAQTRLWRRLTHRRSSLVADRTGMKNRLHAVLAERLIEVPGSRLFSSKGLAWLAGLELDAEGRSRIDSDLRLLAAVEAEITALDQQLAELAYPCEDTRLLMTLPGFDVTVAMGLLAAWGEPARFKDGAHAASYLGIVPSTRQSAERCYHGPITKRGRSHARWLVIQAAQHLDRHPGPLGAFFRRLAKKKGRNIAVVAVARKLAVIAWQMLRHREPYRYAVPRTTETKLARLRVRATGQKRRGGIAKGSPRPASYGSGQPSKGIPSLAQLCHREQLPEPLALEQLPEGERRLLDRDPEVGAFVQSLQVEQRIPRSAPAPA